MPAGHLVADDTMRVSEIMQTDLVTCTPDVTVVAACAAMRRRNVGACLVTDGGRLAGIFTERDLLTIFGAGEDVRAWPVSRAMTTDVTGCPPDADLVWAADTMKRIGVRHLPVTDGECPIGMVSLRDLFAVAEAVLRLDPRGASTALEMLSAATT